MISKRKTVIFVEGFNTAGKDYFIDLLGRYLARPVVYTDPRLFLPVFQKNKRYWDYVERTDQENMEIFKAHVQHLAQIKRLLSSGDPSPVVLSNRSFVSAVHYNLIPTTPVRERQRSDFIQLYRTIRDIGFEDIDLVMVNLCRFHDLPVDATVQDHVEQIKMRVRDRGEDPQFNDEYLQALVNNYKAPESTVKQAYDLWIDAHSGQAEEVAKQIEAFQDR